MKSLRELRATESSAAADELARLAHFILRHRGKFSEAIMAATDGGLAGARGLSMKTREILKQVDSSGAISMASLAKAAIVPPGLTSSPLQDFSIIQSGFLNSLSSAGAFDAMLPDMRQIPLKTGTVGMVQISAQSYVINEAGAKPVSRMSITGAQSTPQKALVAVIVSAELARSPMLAATQLIQRELTNSLAVGSDSIFVGQLLQNIIPANSSGTTASAFRADLEWALRQVSLGANSRPYILTSPAIAETVSMMNSNGLPAFEQMGVRGGSINGIPVLVTDALASGSSANLILVDASQIVAAAGEIALQELTDGTVEMTDTPTSPPTASTNLIDLWSNNLVGIRAERYMLASKLGVNSVAALFSFNSYSGQGSP